LIVYQHVPVERCVRLIADLTGGAAPSTGFVHGLLARCAAVLGEVVTLIKTAVTLAAVAGFDETVIRCGPAGRKKYVLSGSTERACHDNCVSHGWTKIGRRDHHSVGRGTICESGDQHRRS
jgi:hypothetical protein